MSEKLAKDSIYLASGFAHPELSAAIAESLDIEEGSVEDKIHPNGEVYARYGDSVRGKHVFIVQSHIRTEKTSLNDAIMEQCLMADAARSSSASEVTAVIPYMAYMRQDRKSRGREPIGARVLIDQLAVAGVNRILTIDMHAPQSQAIFRGPFDHLTAQRALERNMAADLTQYNHDELVVVAPDAGASKLAQAHQRHLDTDILHMAKQRKRGDSQKITRDEKVPEAEGRVCLVFDDMVDTAGTLVSAAEALKNSGAKAIYVAASHGVFSNPAYDRLSDSPIDRVYVTDTYPQREAKERLGDKLRVVSVAPIIGQAILQIVTNGSISRLFDDENYM